MAEDGFKNTVFALIFMSLFGMLILSAVVTVGNDYDMNTSDVFGGSLSLDKFNSSISDIEDSAKNLKEDFDKGSVWSAIAGVVVEGVFGIGKRMFLLLLTPFDIVSDILLDQFGVPAYVTSVILGLFIISAIFSIWRLLKIGD
jgi:hypothetical protein